MTINPSTFESFSAKPAARPFPAAHNIIYWTIWWPISVLLPLGLVLFVYKGSIILHGHTYSIETLTHRAGHGGLLLISFVLAAFLTEILSVGWAASSLRHMCTIRSTSWWSDVGVNIMYYVHLNRIITVVLSFGISLVSFNWLHDLLMDATGIRIGLDRFPAVPQFVVSLLIYTFLDYWDHRLVHMRVLWPLHRFHHAPTEFYIFTSGRVHPADITGSIIIVGPLVLLGATPDILLAVALLRTYIGSIQHSQITSDWGWFGRWVIYSPTGHRMHHMLDESQSTCNFALIPIWDHLFGTWQSGGSQQIAIGVATPYRHGFWFFPDLWRDYCDFLKELRSFLQRLRLRWTASPE